MTLPANLDAAGLDADRAAMATRACGGRGDYRHPSAIQTLQARFSGITAPAKAGGRDAPALADLAAIDFLLNSQKK